MDEVQRSRSAEVSIRFSEFEMPPMQDLLLIGRRAPIGTAAARRMVEALSPDTFAVLPIDHPKIEALVVRHRLLDLIPAELLIPLLLEECGPAAVEEAVMKAEVDIQILVARRVSL